MQMTRKNKNISTIRRPLPNFSSCKSKRKFKSENDASRAAEMQNLIDMSLDISVYKCDGCEGWHLTRG